MKDDDRRQKACYSVILARHVAALIWYEAWAYSYVDKTMPRAILAGFPASSLCVIALDVFVIDHLPFLLKFEPEGTLYLKMNNILEYTGGAFRPHCRQYDSYLSYLSYGSPTLNAFRDGRPSNRRNLGFIPIPSPLVDYGIHYYILFVNPFKFIFLC